MSEAFVDRSISQLDGVHDASPVAPVSVGHFSAALNLFRRTLPYPDEQGARATPDQLNALSLSIMQPAKGDQMLQYARTMPSRQLMLIFPLLAAQYSRNELTDRLMLIIRERACASLLEVGYVEFQRHYPHPLISPALSALIGILKIRKTPYAPILHDFVPLNSRALVTRCARKAFDKRFSLHRLLTTFRIDPALPFGIKLCAQLFKIGDEAVYQDSALLFEHVLTHTSPDLQASLLTRFFKLERLTPPMFDQYCQIIHEHLGEPVDNLPAWDQVRPKDMVRYAAWIREATIGTHFDQDLTSARFFLRYRRSLVSVNEYDRNTIIMNFPGFSITHCSRWPDSAMYRDLSDDPESRRTHRDPSDDHVDVSPADPRRPHRLPMEALKKTSTAGRVLLLLDPAGIRQSAAFLDYCLSRFRTLPRPVLKGLFQRSQ